MDKSISYHHKIKTGFSLVEVLLALAIISIALTAMLKASSQNLNHTQSLKEKTISHWVAMQGINMMQLGLLPLNASQDISQITSMLGQRWYWRVHTSSTPIPAMKKITISLSQNQAGPFGSPLVAFVYEHT